jgi:protocatechuate 4,5-dioxygenase alpha chain
MKDYSDIPGTYVFDGEQCRKGYRLNMFCMSLNEAANRDEFRADEAAYIANFDLTLDQQTAIHARDWLGMLRLGGNIYYTFKLAIVDGLSMQQVGAAMSGVDVTEFAQMMIEGGRPIDGNRFADESATTAPSSHG